MNIRTYPNDTANPNVPKDAFLVAEESKMSGEIVTTYYIDSEGVMYSVDDWKISKPSVCHLSTLCKLTGDTEGMIRFKYQSFLLDRLE